MISRSESKREEAINDLGAHKFINSSDTAQMKGAAMSLDFLVDTVSAEKDMNLYMSLLDVDGVLVTVGLPPEGINLKVGYQHLKLSCVFGTIFDLIFVCFILDFSRSVCEFQEKYRW